MIVLSAHKQQVHAPGDKEGEEHSLLSFVPKGKIRSAAEYSVALLPGAILLFSFFVAAQTLVFFLPGGDIISAVFLPVICIMPVLSGVVSALTLEKIRSKQLSLARGALVGAAAAFIGSLFSVAMLAAVALLSDKPAFGSALSGWLFYLSLPVILFIEAALGSLGGAIAAHFIK
ncbi:MAG: hypothetical protein N3G22_00205 [Candidatus Micrarchaeota archaeon]|nr:hypothetical protein [Candidatus Micrarchaeota archaeon]